MARSTRSLQGIDVQELRHGAIVELRVTGIIDLLTSEKLSEVVTRVIAAHPEALLIDLSGVAFMSSAAITVLVEARRGLPDTAPLAVISARPATSRPLRIMGIDKLVDIYPSATAAYESLGVPNRPVG